MKWIKLVWLAPYVIIIPSGVHYGWDEGLKEIAIYYPILPIVAETILYLQIRKRKRDEQH